MQKTAIRSLYVPMWLWSYSGTQSQQGDISLVENHMASLRNYLIFAFHLEEGRMQESFFLEKEFGYLVPIVVGRRQLLTAVLLWL